MELYIAIAVVLVVGGYFIYSAFKRADKNNDGKIDAVEAAAVREEVKEAVEEVKVAAKKTAAAAKTGAKKVATKAKTAVKKATAKKK